MFVFFKQKTAYEMRISDWSSDVCSSDLNATSGVVNVVTAKPKLSRFEAEAQFEYGNFNSIEARGMVNVPIGDMIGVRLAGIYVNRDGYTTNLYDGSDIDARDLYALRGSLRFERSEEHTSELTSIMRISYAV